MILDTQIISYCYSGHWEGKEANNAHVSSVTASEFLLFHTRENGKVDYYIVNPNRYGSRHSEALIAAYAEHAKNSKWAKMGAKRTDSIIIDFSNDYLAYRMFGNDAITEIINEKNLNAFKLSISHLDKPKRKMLKKKMEFILDNEMYCHRVNESTCNIGMELLEKFQQHITPKNNIKNTINDILILSTAIDRKVSLLTKDKVLGEFAAKEYSGQIIKNDSSLLVDFSSPNIEAKKAQSESKGYINRGWAYSFSKGNI